VKTLKLSDLFTNSGQREVTLREVIEKIQESGYRPLNTTEINDLWLDIVASHEKGIGIPILHILIPQPNNRCLVLVFGRKKRSHKAPPWCKQDVSPISIEDVIPTTMQWTLAVMPKSPK
jgi:hypothetical protein